MMHPTPTLRPIGGFGKLRRPTFPRRKTSIRTPSRMTMVAPYFVTTEVEIIGQPPRQLIWVGREWCVSTRGVERRDGTFTVDRKHIGTRAMASRRWPLRRPASIWRITASR